MIDGARAAGNANSDLPGLGRERLAYFTLSLVCDGARGGGLSGCFVRTDKLSSATGHPDSSVM